MDVVYTTTWIYLDDRKEKQLIRVYQSEPLKKLKYPNVLLYMS